MIHAKIACPSQSSHQTNPSELPFCTHCSDVFMRSWWFISVKDGTQRQAKQKLTTWSFRSTKLSFSHCGCYTADGCQPFKWSLTNSVRLERHWRDERACAAVSTLKRTAAICSDVSAVGNKPPTDSLSLFCWWDACCFLLFAVVHLRCLICNPSICHY